MMKKYVLLVFCVMMASGLSAQISGSPTSEKVVTLVVSGNGVTKEEATQNALRSAIEQSYGTFVSANTKVLNDEMIKDEIATVSSGNIISFKELSITQMPSGLYDASIQATVSIDQLTKFAQSKGMQAELAGAAFVMNMKMRELNKKNEITAISHMIEKAKAIAQNGLFDYKLEIGEPQLTSDSKYAVKIKILFCENDNTKNFYSTIYNTIKALSLSNTEIEEYKRANINCYAYDNQLIQKGDFALNKEFYRDSYRDIHGIMYVLRNKFTNFYLDSDYQHPWIMPMFMENVLNYEIKDNLGNVWRCKIEKVEGNYEKNYDKHLIIREQCPLIWIYYECIDFLRSTYNHYYYILSPSDRIAGIPRNDIDGLNVPIRNFDNRILSSYLDFNPFKDNVNYINRIYYQQEFLIIYSQDELSRLNSITINHRKY